MKRSKLITNDIKKLVCSACSKLGSINKYKFDHYNRFTIGSVGIIYILGNKPTLHVSEKYTQEYANLWRNDVGGILLNELKKDEPEIYEVKTSSFKAILKQIQEDELEEFNEQGFNHVTVGDTHYTIIKAIKNNRYYSSVTDDYDLDNDFLQDNIITIEEQDNTESEEQEDTSYSLF